MDPEEKLMVKNDTELFKVCASVVSKWRSKLKHHLRSSLMTLAKARAKASTKAKHIYDTGVNYDRHLWLSLMIVEIFL